MKTDRVKKTWKIVWKLLFWSVIVLFAAIMATAYVFSQKEVKKYRQIGIYETAARDHFARARASMEKGNKTASSVELDKASGELEKALRLEPGSSRRSCILELLGDIHLAAGNKALAAEDYKAALDIRDDYREAAGLKEKLDRLLKNINE